MPMQRSSTMAHMPSKGTATSAVLDMKRSASHGGAMLKRQSTTGVLHHEKATDVLNDTQIQARRYAEADSDGDQLLDFDEFLAMQPARLRKKFAIDQFRAWFDTADLDHSGKLSISEFYLWALRNATEEHGPSVLIELFAKYDPDGSGMVDQHEFQKVNTHTFVRPEAAHTLHVSGQRQHTRGTCGTCGVAGCRHGLPICRLWPPCATILSPPHPPTTISPRADHTPQACDDTGFGAVAHTIFRSLDPDGSGEISYRELMSALNAGHNPFVTSESQQLITSMITSYNSESRHEASQARATHLPAAPCFHDLL